MNRREALDFQAARTVLDYLSDNNYLNTRDAFLDECHDLKDPLRFLACKELMSLSLADMLDEFIAVKKSLDDIVFGMFTKEELPLYKTDGVLRKIDMLKNYLKGQRRPCPEKTRKPKKGFVTLTETHKQTNAFVPLSSLEATKRTQSSVSVRITPLKESVNPAVRPVKKRTLSFNLPNSQQIKQFQMGLKVALKPYVRPNSVVVDLSAVPRSEKSRLKEASNTLNIISDVAHCIQSGAMVNKKDIFQPSKEI